MTTPTITGYRDLRQAELNTPPSQIGSLKVETTLGFMLALNAHRDTSLRDDFAKAIAGGDNSGGGPVARAKWAYEVADAMLKERNAT